MSFETRFKITYRSGEGGTKTLDKVSRYYVTDDEMLVAVHHPDASGHNIGERLDMFMEKSKHIPQQNVVEIDETEHRI
jgi:hypothetical protein